MRPCPEPGCDYLNRPSARFCERCGRPLREQRWSPLRPGHTMRGGLYRIAEPLGKGGMGALYLATDTGAFDRRCVVKELLDYYDPTDPTEAQEAQERFETEARLLARLSHPGIPRIYSYFSEAGRHYIVMEYIAGETLERAVTHVDLVGRTVAARPLPGEEVVRHAVRICRVLDYLADQPTPVIHNDIKPANLIVDQTSGEVRLVDFGTARTRTRWATQTRLEQGEPALFGTKGYAPPEQYQGHSEPSSDVYALAVTVYHLLTDDDPGDHPFQFPKMDSLPGLLAEALSRALHPEVQRRSTASMFRQALEAWLIPEDGAQPFVFGSGAVANTTGELVVLCDLHWPEARRHLGDGDLEQWFRARSRHDLVAKVRSAQMEADPDAALEAFLRRIDPRLPPPRLVVEPQALEFGQVVRGRPAAQHLRVRNEGRGYARVAFGASVSWLQFEPAEAGCLAGEEVPVTVRLDVAALPLRRDHQAVVTCEPTRGARISVPVEAKMDLFREVLGRVSARLGPLARSTGRGGRQGLSRWLGAVRSLVRSRTGTSVLVVEVLLLSGSMAALWWVWQGRAPDPIELMGAFFLALPLALLSAGLLSALGYIGMATVGDLRAMPIDRRTGDGVDNPEPAGDAASEPENSRGVRLER